MGEDVLKMFTGIVQYVTTIDWIDDFTIKLELEKDFFRGDSISVNGVCLTVDRFEMNYAYFKLSDKTISITNLKNKKKYCNVEHALKYGESLSGHIVSGHVNVTGVIKCIEGENITIGFQLQYYPFIKHKGSITVDGISLTVAELYSDCFKVAIIPYTWNHTTLVHSKVGDVVNIEFDHYSKDWTHDDYMKFALDISEKSKGYTLPNPWVGCVIVNQLGYIIGYGSHEEYGGNHAEINAINQIKPEEINEAHSIYITLEPCSHIGKTGPCVDSIIALKPSRVIIGITDPNPITSGVGIKKLKESKIEVIEEVLSTEIKKSLEPYIYYNQNQRPYITGKIAMSFNNIYAKESERLLISNDECLVDCHKLRSECSAILVGTKTWINDTPSLCVRYGFKQNPRYKRIIIDNELEHIINEDSFTIFVTFKLKGESNNQIWYCENIDDFLKKLYENSIVHLLIEGGNVTLNRFSPYLNQFIYYVSNDFVDSGIRFKLNRNVSFNSSEIINGMMKISCKF